MKALGRIPGVEEGYFITSTGVVFNRDCKRIATQTTNSGYELVHLSKNGKRIAKTMHRLVAMTFLPNPKNKAYVNHKDGNKLNNDVTNLEWATPTENMWHAYDNGLMSHKGSKNSCSKLTESDIPLIRDLLNEGLPVKKIGETFGVHYSVISKIRKGEIWTHVK